MATIKNEPWDAFAKANPVSLLRIATMLEASYLDPETGEQRSSMGPSGVAVAQEIHNYIGSMKEIRKKAPKKEVPDEIKQTEVRIIETFKSCSVETINRPPILRYGTDRLHIRRAISSGWSPDDILDMIPVFFSERDNPFVFAKGDIKSFIQSLSRLAVMNATTNGIRSPSTVHIPAREIDATNI